MHNFEITPDGHGPSSRRRGWPRGMHRPAWGPRPGSEGRGADGDRPGTESARHALHGWCPVGVEQPKTLGAGAASMSPSGVRAARWTSGMGAGSVHFAPPPFHRPRRGCADAWKQARSFLKDAIGDQRAPEQLELAALLHDRDLVHGGSLHPARLRQADQSNDLCVRRPTPGDGSRPRRGPRPRDGERRGRRCLGAAAPREDVGSLGNRAIARGYVHLVRALGTAHKAQMPRPCEPSKLRPPRVNRQPKPDAPPAAAHPKSAPHYFEESEASDVDPGRVGTDPCSGRVGERRGPGDPSNGQRPAHSRSSRGAIWRSSAWMR